MCGNQGVEWHVDLWGVGQDSEHAATATPVECSAIYDLRFRRVLLVYVDQELLRDPVRA